ncbi:VWA domain-containing protein [Nitrogeniibacter mangrovi]|uniref:VWA domain-containing protein n=1 Tax=Nitrogeniibacter mangrovi TaxID=2016596 RepID=A0A6C1AZZ0_9RHOO|nr:VWA domain-containing protein [Nitrogeniibacter mangrovi]QID16922.1 VWA domain-containing protein [Nitrogeniibacter mangrovi]
MSGFGAFHFLRPAWLLALPLLLGLAAWLGRRRGRDGAWRGLIDPALLDALRLDTAAPAARSPWALLALLWTVAVLALAGPTWQREHSPAFVRPAAWVAVLDLSPSMTAHDVAPDRVSRARFAIDDLLDAAGDGRVALVVFGGGAYTVTPLTRDTATVKALLPPLSPDLMPAHDDALAPALDRAASLLAQAGARHGQVVVLTDGFADPSAAFTAAGRLHRHGATVQVVAVTAAQAAGADAMQRLASAGGGRLTRLDALPGLIATLKASAAAGDAQRAEAVSVDRWREAGVWLLPLLLIATALTARRGWL